MNYLIFILPIPFIWVIGYLMGQWRLHQKARYWPKKIHAWFLRKLEGRKFTRMARAALPQGTEVRLVCTCPDENCEKRRDGTWIIARYNPDADDYNIARRGNGWPDPDNSWEYNRDHSLSNYWTPMKNDSTYATMGALEVV